MLTKGKNIYIGMTDGTFAKIDKSSLNITGEVSLQYNSINGLAKSENKIYNYTDRGAIRAVLDKESPQQQAMFASGHFDVVSSIKFP